MMVNDYVVSVVKNLSEDQVNQIKEENAKENKMPYVAVHVNVNDAGMSTTVSFYSAEGIYYYDWEENYDDFYLEIEVMINLLEELGM